MKKSIIIICLTLAACVNHPCKIEDRTDLPANIGEKGVSVKNDLSHRVFIFKPDGSLQCGQGSKIELNTMKKELADIEVFSSDNQHDGMMRIQVCGHPTGQSNVYEIDKKDLERALKLGFKKWLK